MVDDLWLVLNPTTVRASSRLFETGVGKLAEDTYGLESGLTFVVLAV